MSTAPISYVRLGPGRPLDLAKREAIVAAANALLLRDGVGFTMESVANLAGVAKQTVYNAFPSKQALVVSLLASRIAQLARPIEAADDSQPVAMVLTELARRYMELIFAPTSIALVRVLINATADFDGRMFSDAGPRALHERLSAYLVHQSMLGHLAIPDPDLAAEHFFGLLKGNLQLLTLLGAAEPPGAEECDQRIRSAVHVFLRAYAPLAT